MEIYKQKKPVSISKSFSSFSAKLNKICFDVQKIYTYKWSSLEMIKWTEGKEVIRYIKYRNVCMCRISILSWFFFFEDAVASTGSCPVYHYILHITIAYLSSIPYHHTVYSHLRVASIWHDTHDTVLSIAIVTQSYAGSHRESHYVLLFLLLV